MTEVDKRGSGFAENWVNENHELLKIKAKTLNLSEVETNKLLLGHVVYLINGDDENAFTSVVNNPNGFSPELSLKAKQNIITRMNWEIGVELLPDKLINQMKGIISQFDSLDWEKQTDFKIARNEWLINVKDYFEELLLDKDLSMDEAYKYYLYITYGIST